MADERRAEVDEGDDHLRAVSRVYGPETWDVYAALDRSLDPRGPEAMLDLATERLTPASHVLDIGCRDAAYLIRLVQASGARGVGIDPVTRLIEKARAAVAEVGLGAKIELLEGVMQEIPYPDGAFDLVWCRDVIEVVDEVEAGMTEIARVLRPGGELILFTVLATERLESKDLSMIGQNLAVVPENLDEATIAAAFHKGGLSVVLKDVIGTEWREYAEERTQPVSRDLLRLARLRRQREQIVASAGTDIYGHIESTLHWQVFQFLGKLLPAIYVLRKPA
jgi:ubiquinone/menaquinone biosynthesis C-methylase UbiE